ncbi:MULTISPECIES: PTS sugar transporter subunit IIB [unclassified Sporolactobacillus]|uniref:PTS sugar transporter subunit IIB n=1 Tax=unclassified Sporolactobacillus TaxID=2628533 RepID=UPI0023682BC1|nr:PTS sugar transporter subunit IIB [Sporolactobacillus sp. CQH2019]MDD9148933.1 PTS sugar transporter subunit IIB [Sporolactobacillus sp. CQH2019]
MKKLMIVCGTGVATSTVVTGKVKAFLKAKGLDKQVTLYQSKIADEVNHLDDYDIVISTTIVPDHVKDKVINGVPLLTGVGADKVFEKIKDEIEKSH